MTDDLKNIIESLLFVCDAPLSLERMKSILGFADIKDIRGSLEKLSEEYEARKGGFYLREAAGGYQLCTRPEYKEWIRRLRPSGQARFSKAAMETLAIIAWKQPVIRSDIEHIRGGVDCGGVIRILLERKLIRILGRKEIPGRPLIYGTTRQFLEAFDLNELKDLPSPREIEDLGNISPEDPKVKNPDSESSDIAAEHDLLPPDDNRIEALENQPEYFDAADDSEKLGNDNPIQSIDKQAESSDIADDDEKKDDDDEKKA